MTDKLDEIAQRAYIETPIENRDPWVVARAAARLALEEAAKAADPVDEALAAAIRAMIGGKL